MSYFHCGNGYPDRCNGYKGPLDASVCTSGRHKYDESGRQIPDRRPVPLPLHRTERMAQPQLDDDAVGKEVERIKGDDGITDGDVVPPDANLP